jgi:hypothetical protein
MATRLDDHRLDELSGVVESRRRQGVLFAHNDSGDRARFFALTLTGGVLAEYRVDDAEAVDWEDIAAGPCTQGTCLYLADMGDNDMNRERYTIYEVPEPDVPTELPASRAPNLHVSARALAFRYADGRHNAEALVLDPRRGDLYVITKEPAGPVGVYVLRAPHTNGDLRVAERFATLNLPVEGAQLVTAADLHPCAPRLLVRTYVRLFEYSLADGANDLARLFEATPRVVATSPERQGEAVGWRTHGRGYVTATESAGAAPSIALFACE